MAAHMGTKTIRIYTMDGIEREFTVDRVTRITVNGVTVTIN